MKQSASYIADRSREEPAWFIANVLGTKPWKTQEDICHAIATHPEIAVKSCHGAGKSWLAAQIALWFCATHKPSIVITTAPTDRQVRGILWKEIKVSYKRSKFPLGGTMLTQEWRLAEDWWMWGFTAPDWDPNRFQGFHEANIMVIIDEAAGVSLPIYDAIDAVLSSENVRRMEIGNPTDDSGGFGRSFKTPGIKKFSIKAFDTPNFTEFGITEADILNGDWEKKQHNGTPTHNSTLPFPTLVTPAWVAKRAQRWGIDSPMYRSRVHAEFPTAGADTLIPMGWYEQAKDRVIRPTEGGEHRLGVDVARYGSDESVIADNNCGRVRVVWAGGKFSTVETAGYVARYLLDTGASCAAVDGIGVGAGVVDALRASRQPVRELAASNRSSRPEVFYNAKAEWHWKLREMFQEGKIDVDPDDEELELQATSIKYKVLPSGQIKIEEKDEFKRRTGFSSPDRLESVVHSVADEESAPVEMW